MQVVNGHRELATDGARCAVAIGNFDGVHLGHREIFRRTLDQARALGVTSCVLTFDPHPAKLLAPALAPPLIMPLARRLELIAEQGIARCVVEPFTEAFAALTPEQFVTEVLARGLHA